jgi:16S rRNA (cytosine967-C5)-methyltransferase
LPNSTPTSVSPARAAAFDILLRVEQRQSYASELLHSATSEELSAADHGLTTELVMGVLRWRSVLDAEITRASSQPLKKLDAEVLNALRLGLYQLRWLERVPARASVHESVELVKRARKRSAATFVNAVLRKLQASGSPARDEAAESAAALAERYAHPRWLVERWAKTFDLDTARRICMYDQERPQTAIRLRDAGSEDDIVKQGIRLAPGLLVASARRVETGSVARTGVFATGRISVQDEASQLVALLVGQGKRILDCCAAPGGKTAILAERNPGSKLVAAELHPHRAQLLRRLTGADNVQVVAADARELPFAQGFDRILVDAPCSGTGTLARHPEIKWRLRPEDLGDLHGRQVAILRSGLGKLRASGRLVYATCSLEREENSDVVDRVLRDNPLLQLVDCREELKNLRKQGVVVADDDTLGSLVEGPYLRTIPGIHPCDGFFAAILEMT